MSPVDWTFALIPLATVASQLGDHRRGIAADTSARPETCSHTRRIADLATIACARTYYRSPRSCCCSRESVSIGYFFRVASSMNPSAALPDSQ